MISSDLVNLEMAANIIGVCGTICVVSAYFLMQLNKLNPKGWRYNVINLAGAIFLLLSLLVHFNLASFIIELFWITASVVGLYNFYHVSGDAGDAADAKNDQA